jgi:Uma2 family endonuclease
MDTFAHVRAGKRPTTQAAEGLPRWRWTTADIERLTAAGCFDDMDRIELIGGEMVPMPADGRRHSILVDRIFDLWVTREPARLRVGEEKQFNLDEATYTKPDILVWRRGLEVPDVRGPDALLVVEVADSSLSKDLDVKRRLYAAFGVREYWVIAAENLTTTIHTDPQADDYASVVDRPATALLVPRFASALSVQLSDLGA